MKRIVVTIHGIRTHGQWQERLTALLNAADPTIDVVNYKYGFFSTLAFIVPLTRSLITRRFRREFVELVRTNPDAEFDIVAHSFGTHLAAWGIKGIKNEHMPVIRNVILAGSVLKPNFPWNELLYNGRVKRVINDCGINDNVLALNQVVVLMTGMAGRVGFSGMTSARLINRWHLGGHSHYFERGGKQFDAFMVGMWVPILAENADVKDVDDRPSLTFWGGLVLWGLKNATPIKMTIYSVVVLLPTVWIFGLYQEEKRQRSLAEMNQREAEVHREIAISLREEADIQRANALELVEWLISRTVLIEFDRTEIDADTADVIVGLIRSLKRTGYIGRVSVEAHVGRFCRNSGDEELADHSLDLRECDFMSRSYALQLGMQMAESLQNVLSSAGFLNSKIEVSSFGLERPRLDYPEKGSAGDWNRVAKQNNRIEVRLMDVASN
jgi:outer membrane protein OmpA-like peptidoglycan-associated protein